MKLTTKSYGIPAEVQKQIAGGIGQAFSQAGQVGRQAGGAAFVSDIERMSDPDVFRAWRESIPWIARAVGKRRDQAMSAQPAARKIGGGDPSVQEQAAIDTSLAVLNNPDPEQGIKTYAGLIGPLTEDYLVVGLAVGNFLFEDQTIIGIRHLDAAKFHRNPKYDPEKAKADPQNPDVAKYLYRVTKDDVKGYSDDEVILFRSNPTTYQWDGLSPMRCLNRFLLAEKDVFRSMHIASRNLQVSGIIKVPNPQKGIVAALENQLKSKMMGKGGIAVAGLPAGSDFMKTGTSDLHALGAFDLYDLLVRGIAAAFATTTTALNWTKTTLERTAAQQGELDDEGGVNLLLYLAQVFTTGLIQRFEGAEDCELYYPSIPSGDESDSVDVVKEKSGPLQPWTLAQLISAAGEDMPENLPEAIQPYYHEHIWPDGKGGWLPISMFEELRAQAMTPSDQGPAVPDQSGDGTAPAPDAAAVPIPDQALQPVAVGAGRTNGNGRNGATKHQKQHDPGDAEAAAAISDFQTELDRIFREQYDRAWSELGDDGAEPADE